MAYQYEKHNDNNKLNPINYCKYCRGQVWWEKAPQNYDGSVQNTDRPVVIISDDYNNSVSSLVIVVPMTTRHKYHSESIFKLPFNERNSIVLADQPRTVPKEWLNNYLYSLSDDIMNSIVNSIEVAIGIRPRTMPVKKLSEEERNKEEVIDLCIPEKTALQIFCDTGLNHLSSKCGISKGFALSKIRKIIDDFNSKNIDKDLCDKAAEKLKYYSSLKNSDNNSNNESKPSDRKNEVLELHKAGRKVSEISEITGVSITTIYRYIRNCNNNTDGKTSIKENKVTKSVDNKQKDSDYDPMKIYNLGHRYYIQKQWESSYKRGDLVNILRNFQKGFKSSIVHPVLKTGMNDNDLYSYMTVLYDMINNDNKLKRDIRRISHSLYYKIQALKCKEGEVVSG